jgi:hypothetical protein
MVMKSNYQKTNHKSGRRAYERLSIPGVTLSWKYMDESSFPDETLPLSDISRFGVAFLTNTPPEEDSDISLRINFPKPPKLLELYCKVIYSIFRGPGLTYEYRVGVNLKPFSGAEGDNLPQSQEVIEELEQMYGKKLNTQDIED